ncbi:MAG: M50 family metallopeptidase [Ruminococcaceae bacterium]|nr:M50 family metallopeptidase [Oscillospiraceae bacterium]
MKMYQIGSHIDAFPYEETKLSIYNKSTGKTFVLGEKEACVFKCLNGANSLSDIHKQCGFYSKEEIEKLINAFGEIGLFESGKRKFNPLKIKMRLFNPNKLMKEDSLTTKVLHYLILWGWLAVLLTGVFMFRANINNPAMYASEILFALSNISTWDIVAVVALSLVCLSIHEFAHMITARRYGVNVPEIGVMLYFLIPCAYTNITGINLLKSKGKRLVVLLSGSLVNLGIIGICFALMALISSPIMGMYGAILILVNLGTIFMNTLVLLKFDGYYVLETILDEPGLREKAITHLFGFLKLLFSKNKEEKKAFSSRIKSENTLLIHLTYCFYAVLSLSYVPFVLVNTVIPFIS